MPPNARCLPVPRASCSWLRSSSIESLVLVSAPPVRRAVAWLLPGWQNFVRPRRMCACALKQAAPISSRRMLLAMPSLRGEYVVQEILISDLWCPCIGHLFFFLLRVLGAPLSAQFRFGNSMQSRAKGWRLASCQIDYRSAAQTSGAVGL
jgi:hypothetical protein